MNWIVNRLQEPSTWRGLVWLLTAIGVSLSPEAWQYITTAGMALAGLIGVLTREQAQTVNVQLPPIELVGQSLAGRTDTDCCSSASRVQSSLDVPPTSTSAVDVHPECSAALPVEGVFNDSFGDK